MDSAEVSSSGPVSALIVILPPPQQRCQHLPHERPIRFGQSLTCVHEVDRQKNGDPGAIGHRDRDNIPKDRSRGDRILPSTSRQSVRHVDLPPIRDGDVAGTGLLPGWIFQC